MSRAARDRKSTRLNSSHLGISYAVFCLKKKKLLLGKMRGYGFTSRWTATLNVLTEETINSSSIEGVVLDPENVRSSLARRLFFFNERATTEIYTLSLHDALPI